MSEITDGWLRSHGFKWEDHPHGRHWLLWIGRAIPDSRRCGDSSDFGIEIAPRLMSDGKPSLFFRADYAGRYNRFLFCRQLNSADDLMRIIESIIHPHAFDDCLTPYGFLTTPEQAMRLKKEAEAIDVRLAKQTEAGWHGHDADDRAVHVDQRKSEATA